jgi:hypothetical protein
MNLKARKGECSTAKYDKKKNFDAKTVACKAK